MIPCYNCGAAFWTPEGLAAHPCIGYVPANTRFFNTSPRVGLNAAAGNTIFQAVG